jgi:hypothetical protein
MATLPPVLPIAAVNRPRALLRGWLALLLVLRGGAVFASYALSGTLLNLQDRWLLYALLAAAALTLAPWEKLWAGARPLMRSGPLRLGRRAVWGLALGVVAVGYTGHYLLLAGYDLSRDEQMASFDALIYAHGAWAWPLPRDWHRDSSVLNMLFMLPVDHPVAWVSGYLPGNALWRAGVGGLLGDAALANPLLSGGTVVALWAVARRLWPQDGENQALPVLLLLGSGQFLATGMTSYAMPAHLLCNLVWLRLFLADTRRADMAALAVGFVATGLHQPLFHPMFVAPWLAVLLWQRRWGRLALFVLPYGAIGLFWLSWPNLVTLPAIMGAGSTRQVGADFLSRLIDTLSGNAENFPIMACNLLRFCTWNALALVPLLLAGLWALARKPLADMRMLALAVGFVVPPLMMLAILPYQGHGFGYRYLHPVLGNGLLLATYGWQWLVADGDGARLRALLVRALAFGALLALPLQGWLAHHLYAPFAQVSAQIDALPADYVLIGPQDAPYALDLVLNRPDLSNRPLRLSQNDIEDTDRLAAKICATGATIALPVNSAFVAIDKVFGVKSMAAGQHWDEDSAYYADMGCRVIKWQ